MQFVVTEDVANAGTTVKFSPAINSDSTSARANVSNAIPNGASVSFFGKASTSYRVNIAYTDESGKIHERIENIHLTKDSIQHYINYVETKV